MIGWRAPAPEGWQTTIEIALGEDIGSGDISGSLLQDRVVSWFIESQANGILCGAGLAYELLTPAAGSPVECIIELHCSDGEVLRPGIKVVSGRLLATQLLSRERVALNFLMMLSGCATLTHQFVDAIAGTSAMITDTRKTIPGLRALQKYAVRCGGARNHRMGLYDAVMLKDNHIVAAGGVAAAIRLAKDSVGHTVKIEVECENLQMVREAAEAGADIIMLDNMTFEDMKRAAQEFKGQAILEASGGISLQTVRQVAETGVDLISVGAITHSSPALPLHLTVL